MAGVYALLVGINAYPPSVRRLRGCLNDVAEVARYLDETAGASASVRIFRDHEATREAVIDGFRTHLRRAGPGDAAMFWFCGHGAQVELPPEWRHLSTTGWMQTLVCADSRVHEAARDLLDQELRVLLRELVGRGAHVVAVLDCCHAGGLARDSAPGAIPRYAEPAKPDPAIFAALARGIGRIDDAGYVVLAACQSNQRAYEKPGGVDNLPRGAFTSGLLAELRRAGGARTYRDLLAAARAFVENEVDDQSPRLSPIASAMVDQAFLGGTVRQPLARMVMWWHRDQWVVDAGTCHGLPPMASAASVRFAVIGSEPVREARLVRADPGRSVVEPIGWRPVEGSVYPVVLSAVALPEVRVAIGGRPADDPVAAEQIRQAVRTAGPNGVESPHLRVVPWADEMHVPDLVVATDGEIRIETPDGRRLDPGNAAGDPPLVVAQLEHIAVWRRIRTLENPLSGLADSVRLRIVPSLPGEHVAPMDREGLRTGDTGVIELRYHRQAGGVVAPTVFVTLENTSDRELFCVLLDLTDRFRIHADLFPGAWVRPGARVAAGGGQLIRFSLPPGRELTGRAMVRDWLLLAVSEEQVNAGYFVLARLGEPPTPIHRGGGLPGVLERLALTARSRDADVATNVASDWWTSVTCVETRVS